MDRLPTNHAIILENVNLGFDINKFHSQDFNIILLVLRLYSSNNYYYDYGHNIKWGKYFL